MITLQRAEQLIDALRLMRIKGETSKLLAAYPNDTRPYYDLLDVALDDIHKAISQALGHHFERGYACWCGHLHI